MKTKTNFLKLLLVAGALAICSGAFAETGLSLTKPSRTVSNGEVVETNPKKLRARDSRTMLLRIIAPPNPHKRVLNFIEKTRYS